VKTAGVVIDAWKLPVFRRHLDTAKRDYTEHPGITPDTLTLKVKYDWVHELQPIIEAANAECAQIKARSAVTSSSEHGK
jgi:hypothetical protein